MRIAKGSISKPARKPSLTSPLVPLPKVPHQRVQPSVGHPRAAYLRVAIAAERLAKGAAGLRKKALLKAAGGFRTVAKIKGRLGQTPPNPLAAVLEPVVPAGIPPKSRPPV